MYLYTIAGCIAAGKTALVNNVAEISKLDIICEDCDNNPFLKNYYEDMRTYAYDMQIWYLNNRILQLSQNRNGMNLIQDQTLEAFGYIFPSLQVKNGFLTEEEFTLITTRLNEFLKQNEASSNINEIIFYLRVKESEIDKLINRIRNERGRDFELSIKEEYVLSLIQEYEKWFNRQLINAKQIIALNAFASMEDNVDTVMAHVV